MILTFNYAQQGQTCAPALVLLREHAKTNNLESMTWDEVIEYWETLNKPEYIAWCLRNKPTFAQITGYTIPEAEAARDAVYLQNLASPVVKHYTLDGDVYNTLEEAQRAAVEKRQQIIGKYKDKHVHLVVVNMEVQNAAGDALWTPIQNFELFLQNQPQEKFSIQIFNPLSGVYTGAIEDMTIAKAKYDSILEATVMHFEPNSFDPCVVLDYVLTPEGKKVYFAEANA